ncbi:MAG: cold shock domain-containing protein [Acidobacteria bacterium]|nr:cold shock domain-containing protein [Acidobacteriota bacterium]
MFKKAGSTLMTGTIKRLVTERRFGFIRTQDGQEVFFHASAVSGSDFHSLSVGQEVNCDIERGDKGLKAANVRVRREQPLS